MTVAQAIRSVEEQDADLFSMLQDIYKEDYSGAVILHCIHGVPRVAEFPSKQIKLHSSLDKQGWKA